MTKTCPGCNVLAPNDARYCRHCGAPLLRVGATGDAAGGDISPSANTVPLSGQNTTDEIVAHPAPRPAASHTSEVTREEMHDLWRRATPGGELRDGAPAGGATDRKFESTRDAREGHNSSPVRQVENFQGGPNGGYAPGDFDPEQTQITIPVRPLTSRNLPSDAAAASAAAARANSRPQFNNAP
ncbi:MAG TPA: zinc ribbon domain-containing protein, partial [Pyrinomonadaceae bacterium]